MPTYNRAPLLRLAVQSVLQQTFEDFEVVISNGGSTDETRDVVAEFTDKRIRYVESQERLNIGDNYQNALDNATGEYITFLSDDDAFVPATLERVNRVIVEEKAEVVAFRVSSFYHDGDVQFNRTIGPNTLAVSSFTGEVTKFTKAEAISKLYSYYGLGSHDFDDRFIVSYLANAVYHHSVFARIRARRSKLFEATPADMYLAAAVFHAIDNYHCLDEPLHIWSNWADNATASAHKKGNKIKEHYRKLLNGQKLEFVRLQYPFPYNCAINAILQARDDFKETGKVDWVEYYFKVYENLMYLRRMGVDVDDEVRDFHSTVAAETRELRQKVNARIKSPSFITKEFLRDFPRIEDIGKRLLRRRKSDKTIFIDGEEKGFNDVLGAADFLMTNLLPKVG
jgi:glycosyltransferase involved in cell wall biosynthesis